MEKNFAYVRTLNWEAIRVLVRSLFGESASGMAIEQNDATESFSAEAEVQGP